MPPLEPDGTSLLWEALGRKFTGLSYQEADRLSQDNKEFIRALFPQDPIYASLLPRRVQELIGQVGPDTKGVEKMLREVGFSYADRIDPFDGGPHFHARTDEISLVRQARTARVVAEGAPAGGTGGAAPPCWSMHERPVAPARAGGAGPRRHRPPSTKRAKRAGAVRRRLPVPRRRSRWRGRRAAVCRKGRRCLRQFSSSTTRRTSAARVRMVLEGEGYHRRGGGERRGGAGAARPRSAPTSMLLDVQLPGHARARRHRAHRQARGPRGQPTIIIISGHATLADAVRGHQGAAPTTSSRSRSTASGCWSRVRNALERRAMAREVAGAARPGRRALDEMVGRERRPCGALRAQIAKVAPTADARAHHRRVAAPARSSSRAPSTASSARGDGRS